MTVNEYAVVCVLTAMPMLSMIGGSLLVQWKSPGVRLTSLLQHFASGVVTAAVAAELLPDVMAPDMDTVMEYCAMLFGFIFGVVVMLLVSRVSDYLMERSESKAMRAEKQTEELLDGVKELHHVDYSQSPSATVDVWGQVSEEPTTVSSESTCKVQGSVPDLEAMYDEILRKQEEDAGRNARLLVRAPETKLSLRAVASAVARLPWGILVPVMTDASMDGLLIGISFMAGSVRAGLVIAIALTVEMCFLGVSLSTVMSKRKTPLYLSVPICVFVPMLIPTAGFIGTAVLAIFGGALEMAVLSFGVAALLYLVSDELLPEAHKEEEADTWYVTMFFFIGFGLVLILQKYTDNQLNLFSTDSASSSVSSP